MGSYNKIKHDILEAKIKIIIMHTFFITDRLSLLFNTCLFFWILVFAIYFVHSISFLFCFSFCFRLCYLMANVILKTWAPSTNVFKNSRKIVLSALGFVSLFFVAFLFAFFAGLSPFFAFFGFPSASDSKSSSGASLTSWRDSFYKSNNINRLV